MAVPYAPLVIANSFIRSFAGNDGIEHMKLQKLVYCAYGWWLASYGLNHTRLTTEGPEIWKHGPVFSSLYQSLKEFGRQPILNPQSTSPFSNPEFVPHDDRDVVPLLHWIWGKYGHLTGFALSDLTHKPGTPWHRIAMESNFTIARHTQIPDQYIYEEFTRLLHLAQGTVGNTQGVIDRDAGIARAN